MTCEALQGCLGQSRLILSASSTPLLGGHVAREQVAPADADEVMDELVVYVAVFSDASFGVRFFPATYRIPLLPMYDRRLVANCLRSDELLP
jgi:hypothetical protein